MNRLPRILIIAGSDSSGGAGIQADIKTVSMLGGYAMSAVTAVTAQHTCGVQGVWPLPPEAVAQQIRACLEDIGADAIKLGMLHDAAIIEAVTRQLAASDLPIILDPVMVASSGDRLLDEAALTSLRALMPYAELITPNIPEAAILSDCVIDNRDDMLRAAQGIGGNVLLKGGHLPGDTVHDLLWFENEAHWLHSPRIESRHTHGTGCTLASAIATLRGEGLPIPEAVTRARAYVLKAIQTAPGFGRGHGPLNHLHPLGC